MGQLRGSDGAYICSIYDYTLTGESITAPHLRACPLRAAHLKKMISGVIASRDLTDALHPGDLYMLLDAGRAGNEAALMSGFTKESDGKTLIKNTTCTSSTPKRVPLLASPWCAGRQSCSRPRT